MKYSQMKYNDIVNGDGIRTSLFVSGCRNNCNGCFNVPAQDFNYGVEFTEATQQSIFDSMSPYIDGISLLGGEPMEIENARELVPFVKKFKELFPDKTVWIFSGYLYEDILEYGDDRSKLLLLSDVIVDGKFVKELRDVTLKFRGSSNQRIIDIKSGRRIDE